MKSALFAVVLFLSLIFSTACHGIEMFLETSDVKVIFEEENERIAIGVVRAFPFLISELEDKLGWKIELRPKVKIVLAKEDAFKKRVKNRPVVAFAVSEGNIIVVDFLNAETPPSNIKTTLKHELLHLVLESRLSAVRIPRWLNEGVAQWASGGISEFRIPGATGELAKAILTGRLIPLRSLDRDFPDGDKPLQLAYEESLDIVEYIVSEYGRERLLGILNRLKEGDTAEEAVLAGLSVSMDELIYKWHGHLIVRHTWLTYLSNNIYTVLFVFAAILTAAGFIRVMVRLKTYKDSDEDTP